MWCYPHGSRRRLWLLARGYGQLSAARAQQYRHLKTLLRHPMRQEIATNEGWAWKSSSRHLSWHFPRPWALIILRMNALNTHQLKSARSLSHLRRPICMCTRIPVFTQIDPIWTLHTDRQYLWSFNAQKSYYVLCLTTTFSCIASPLVIPWSTILTRGIFTLITIFTLICKTCTSQ